jgi:hypothetical protein
MPEDEPVSVFSRLLLALYLLEAGLLLAIAPWSGFWQRNYFTVLWPWLATLMGNPFVRGAITGVGVVSVLAAIAEVLALVDSGSDSPDWRDQGA